MSVSYLALSSIADEFGVTLRAVGWVVIIESLLVAALLLPFGYMADVVGRRRILVTGMVVFAIGSLLTGISPSFAWLIGARVVMSLGNALAQSVATGMIVSTFPSHERGLALGAQSTAVSIGAASGPLIGGFAIGAFGWASVFLAIAAPSLLALVPIYRFVAPDSPAIAKGDSQDGGQATGFDTLGAALAGLAVVAVVVTTTNPFGFDWISAPVGGGLLVGVGLIAAFIRRELAYPVPMLELRLFANRVFRTAVLVRLLGFLGASVSALLLPIYLLSVRQVSETTAGFVLFALPLGMGISAIVSGRWSDRVGPRTPSLVGVAAQLAATGALAITTDSTPVWLLAVAMGFQGLAMGLWNVPSNSAMMGATPTGRLGVGGAFSNVTRTMGGVLSQAMAVAIVVGVMAGQGFDIPLGEVGDTVGAPDSFIDGWRLAFTASAAATFTAGLVALSYERPKRAL